MVPFGLSRLVEDIWRCKRVSMLYDVSLAGLT
jgi:hypothetical protein